jgi:hypothetical protein
MFARLRLDRLVGGDDEQHRVDAAAPASMLRTKRS